jgi:hypothetical protein
MCVVSVASTSALEISNVLCQWENEEEAGQMPVLASVSLLNEQHLKTHSACADCPCFMQQLKKGRSCCLIVLGGLACKHDVCSCLEDIDAKFVEQVQASLPFKLRR